jgi:hypothetical protein
MNFKMLGSSVAFGGRYGENSCGRIDFGCNCVIATCLLQRELWYPKQKWFSIASLFWCCHYYNLLKQGL